MPEFAAGTLCTGFILLDDPFLVRVVTGGAGQFSLIIEGKNDAEPVFHLLHPGQ